MIQLKVVKKKNNGVKNQFVIDANEPITVEFTETEKGHTIAYVYRGTSAEIDEYTDPVGVFDSSVENHDWVIE